MTPTDVHLKRGPSEAIRMMPTEGETFVKHGYGHVGTGKTAQEAHEDLWEKIKQARAN